MAEGPVCFLLTQLGSFLMEEVNLLTGVEEEIEHVKDEFEHMRAFLRVADAHEDNDPQLKVWVKQVRDAAYDTGDVLEKFTLQIQHRHSGNNFRRFIHKPFTCVNTLIVCHQVASEITRIKVKVRNLSESYQRYRDIYNITERGLGSNTTFQNSLWYDCRSDALFLEEQEIVGIERPKAELVKWLANEDSSLQVLSVVGMGGLGKTALVKKVFDDNEMRENFYSHAWITVSESYKVDALLKTILEQLFKEVNQPFPLELHRMDSNCLKALINDFLNEKRYILVIDDLWDIHVWHALRYAFPNCNCGSRVIITTRNADVASLATEDNIYNLLPLPEDESWALFCKKAFRINSCPSHLERISRDILRKCEGLPLAIVAIGGLLSAKDKRSTDEWERVYRTLGTELEGNDKLCSLKKILLLSYIDLPYYLKLCFLYLSIYPEAYLIDHWRLVRLLIAEGFVESKQGMTVEEVAETYLKELVTRNLILVAELSADGRAKAYRMHDFWREIITFKAMEQNHVTIGGAQKSWSDKVRRLSIHKGLTNRREIKHAMGQIRSLFIFGSVDEKTILFMLSLSKSGASLLKVLDLRDLPLAIFPGKLVKLLHLKYLSLRGTKIKVIPKTIGNLQMLETLDLKDTFVTKLPIEILKLHRLRHLLVYRYLHGHTYLPFQNHFGFRAPKGIGGLSCLQKLCSIELNQDRYNDTIIRELGRLNQLRKINILQVKSKDGRELCSSLEKLSKLRSLSICAADEDQFIYLDSLRSPPQFLRTLGIKGLLKSFPLWITSLHNVVKLSLRNCKLNDDPLKHLQDLPNLARLYLDQAYEGQMLTFEARGFQRLIVLWLVSLNGLKSVKVMGGAMPRLERLSIYDCASMEELPRGIESLSCLRLFELMNMSDRFVTTLSPDVPDGDYQRIAHIPEVLIGFAKIGSSREHAR